MMLDATKGSNGRGHAGTATCLYCGQTSEEVAIEGVSDFYFDCVSGSFDFFRCGGCNSLILSPQPTDEQLNLAYSRYYTHAEPEAETNDRSIKAWLKDGYSRWHYLGKRDPISAIRAFATQVLSKEEDDLGVVHRYAPSPGKTILDFGCGNGSFLAEMKKRGHTAVGVELDESAASVARGLGVEVHSPAEAEARNWVEIFDYISLSHVIEHVRDPVDLLRQLHSWLKPDGVLYIEAPNSEAAGLEIFGKYWRGLEAPRHLSVPSARGIMSALVQAGFVPEQKRPRNYGSYIASLTWPASLSVVPSDKAGPFERQMTRSTDAPLTNPEFLYFLARKQD